MNEGSGGDSRALLTGVVRKDFSSEVIFEHIGKSRWGEIMKEKERCTQSSMRKLI